MGYKTNIHKIRNLPPHQNSKLKNIHLLGLAYVQDVKKYGFNKILQNFVAELKLLEHDGLEIDFITGQSAFRGGLVAISGDNLGANGLMGFVESFSAHNYCRHCLTHKSYVNKVVSESQTILRSV